jgi:transcriptional regulator with XRE-family HTH domain
MSQRDLAARACITVSYLDKIERGICRPSCPTITGLACGLGVDWDELYALAGKVPFDIIHMLVRAPLLLQLVRLGSQCSYEQVLPGAAHGEADGLLRIPSETSIRSRHHLHEVEE